MNKNNALHRFQLWLRWGTHNRINRFRFDRSAREILRTPAVKCKDDGCVIISLVSHRDLWMYLVSAASFAHFFNRGRYVVVNDGSLTAKDIQILKRQIMGLEVKDIAGIPNEHCPKGGCWERLLCVADYVHDNYVIVLDADMVTQSDVSEVKACVTQNRNFIMGLKEDQTIKYMRDVMREEVVRVGKKTLSDRCHIQTIFDTNMDRIEKFDDLKYLKGSGGFNGFARGSLTREDVERFSKGMLKIFGARWNEWGTEQIAVCFLIANSPSACILPCPKYVIYYARKECNYCDSSVLHFVGMARFRDDFYRRSAKALIAKLKI